MNSDHRSSRARSLTGTIMIYLPGIALFLSSILKLAHIPGVVEEMARAGFAGEKLILVASLEMLSACLFLYPRTRSFGVLFLSSFLGGAICTHVQMGEFAKVVPPAILLTLAWSGMYLRSAELLWKPTGTHLPAPTP